MNFRNKYLVITLRTLFGLMLLYSGIAGLFLPLPTEGIAQNMLDSFIALKANGIMQMIKVTEIIAGLLFVTGLLPALGAILTAPIGIGMIVFFAFIDPKSLPVGVIFSLINAYFGYVYWDKYKTLFVR